MRETNSKLVFDQPVVLIGGASFDESVLQSFVVAGWPIVAADGGANSLLGTEITPTAIVGDLDSLQQPEYWRRYTRVIEVVEQDTTDFEKCLYSVEAPLVVALGFTGQRFDHTLVTLHLMQKYVDHQRLLLITERDVCFACRGDLQLTLPVGGRFSIYPLTPSTFVASAGLAYPLDGLCLKQGSLIGTSNQVSAAEVQVEATADGVYVVIVSVSLLSTLLQQLA